MAVVCSPSPYIEATSMSGRKSKMISFRLSLEEYGQLRTACATHGIPSISELARAAMRGLLSPDRAAIPVQQQMQEIRDRIALLTTEIDRLKASSGQDHVSKELAASASAQ